ncbi:MAG: L-serine ammonia-lyase, partial [Pseudomonadota bacterium]
LAATGIGHGTDKAILLGLEGEQAELVDVDIIESRIQRIKTNSKITLLGDHIIDFDFDVDVRFHHDHALEYHSNGLTFTAIDHAEQVIAQDTFFSIGGGFVVNQNDINDASLELGEHVELAYPFSSAAELLELCEQHNLSVSELMLENEKCWREESDIRQGLLNIWRVMRECVDRGCHQQGYLPGGLNVKRRAAQLFTKLNDLEDAGKSDPLCVMDWVNLYALAVNEENASGGRVVTAPTNGAAGIVPAVLHYYDRFVPEANESGVIKFMLAAGAVGILFKLNASISGAEVGCQGEVGSACSMAAAGLTEALGGTPAQVENAAEIAMEHNLGLTCDPIGGLVQVPCIERNAIASVKAINATRLARRGDGEHFVSLDRVIKTMRETGADMQTKYKETSLGGLAVNVIEC